MPNRYPRVIDCDVCGKPYEQKRARHTRHQACSSRINGVKNGASAPQPRELAQVRVQARERAEMASWRAELKRLMTADEGRRRYIETIERYAPLLSVPTLEKAARDTSKPRHTWVIVLSDLHVGQRTESEHTGGIFEQSLELTRGQVRSLWQTIELLHGIYSKSLNIERLVILQLGDLVEGSGMRPSQATKIDETVTKQTIEVADLMSWFVNNALSLFPRVQIENVGGNHDRVSQKPGDGGLGELGYHDTYAWLIGEIERRMFKYAIESERLVLNNHESFFGGAVIADRRFVFEHGASFKTSSGSYGGIGWYPIQAAGGRYQQMLDGADVVVMGHFHTGAMLPLGRGWQVLNGALPPSTHWVQATFKRVNTPLQMMLDVHRKLGIVSCRPLYVPHDGIALPGAYWQRLEAQAKAA